MAHGSEETKQSLFKMSYDMSAVDPDSASPTLYIIFLLKLLRHLQ
jgi:hypothetical protein